MLVGLAGIILVTAWLVVRHRRTEVALRTEVETRRHTEDELERHFSMLRRLDEERRGLLTRLVGVQDEERRRIATDLHDDSIQVMTALRLRLGALRSRTEDPEMVRQLEKLEGEAHDAIIRLRRLMFDLYPTDLDRQGLMGTLRHTAATTLQPDGIECGIDDRLTRDLPDEVRMAAYRIAREALTNVRKHARAHRVDVLAETDPTGLLLRITDDGVGFVPEETEAGPPGHLGLVSMRERAELVGGRCLISSAPGAGTTVELRVPLGDAAAGRPA